MRVAVIGGGPAAATAALRLARRGHRATLYHPARPGEKPCGGALPGYLLGEVDGFDASGLPAIDVGDAVLENASGSRVALQLSGLRIFRRLDLDPALVAAAARAGAEIRAERVRRIEWESGLPVVGTDGGESAYDWVVAGDGARGLTRRSLELEPVGESFGLGASLPGVEAEALTLSFPGVGDAYLWIFPRPGGCSVGIAYSSTELSPGAARSCLDDFLSRHLGRRLAELGGSRYRYPIPVYGPWTAEAVETGIARRVLLVGDAAALADPLTREGIRYAVRSGSWAADAVADGEPTSYAERLIGAVDADLSRAGRARELFFDAPIGQWMIPVCRSHPGVRRVLADLLACRQPYVGLRRRLLSSALGFRSPQVP